MGIRPIFFKEICFTISLKNGLHRFISGSYDFRGKNREADFSL